MSKAADVRTIVYDDHEVLHPPNTLKRAIIKGEGAAEIDLSAIERAEQALATLSAEFTAWMENELRVLDAARYAVRAEGMTDETRARLFRAAHDLKGDAATFGYPLAGQMAGSLCRLIDEIEAHEAIPLDLVTRHVDAIRALVREGARGEGDGISRALAEWLEAATGQAIERAA